MSFYKKNTKGLGFAHFGLRYYESLGVTLSVQFLSLVDMQYNLI